MNENFPPEAVNKDLFERVWNIYSELGVEERHFNGLQSTYRSLASTWLLAAFAAFGFVLSERFLNSPFDKLLVIVAIGFMASIGIVLTWNLDLRVYHQLLASAFMEGLLLEETYSWLPQMRHNMMNRTDGRGVVPRVVWFYIVGSCIPLIISGVAFVFWCSKLSVLCSISGGFSFALLILALGTDLFQRVLFEQIPDKREEDKGSNRGK